MTRQTTEMAGNAASWRLLLTPAMPAAWNMACDEALGEAVRAGRSLPVVRFFQWNPPAVSFGYSQRIAREVDVDLVRRDGIGMVRRVTGGRAVLHADEITYSVICRESDPVAAGGITATYARISEGLATGLRACGVPADLARASDPAAPLRAREATLPCFGSTARAEVVVAERKLIGSAQHRMRGLMIQHGSILLGPRHRDLVRYLRADGDARERFARRLEESTTSLAELGWPLRDVDGVVERLAAGLADVLGITFRTIPLAPDECAATERLSEEKYGADWWNFPPAKEADNGPMAR